MRCASSRCLISRRCSASGQACETRNVSFVSRRRFLRRATVIIEQPAEWGYTRIAGALKNVGHRVSRSTIARTLKAAGVPPVPERPTSWQTFLKAHWGVIAGADFFTTEVWTWRGLVTSYTVFVIETIRSERAHCVFGQSGPPKSVGSGHNQCLLPTRSTKELFVGGIYVTIGERGLSGEGDRYTRRRSVARRRLHGTDWVDDGASPTNRRRGHGRAVGGGRSLRIDDQAFVDGLRFFRNDQFAESRLAFALPIQPLGTANSVLYRVQLLSRGLGTCVSRRSPYGAG